MVEFSIRGLWLCHCLNQQHCGGESKNLISGLSFCRLFHESTKTSETTSLSFVFRLEL